MNGNGSRYELFAGWIGELDIWSGLARLRRKTPDLMRFGLVTMVDSSSNVADLPSLARPLRALGAEPAIIGGGVSLDVLTLERLHHEFEYFNGFDEIWLGATAPRIPKPPDIRITSDTKLRAPTDVTLANWMLDGGLAVGLGDGDGLNYVTVTAELRGVLIASG